MHVYLKGQCPEILDPFLKEKTLPGMQMNKQKWFHEIFVLAQIFQVRLRGLKQLHHKGLCLL